jgi:hypothetical protein
MRDYERSHSGRTHGRRQSLVAERFANSTTAPPRFGEAVVLLVRRDAHFDLNFGTHEERINSARTTPRLKGKRVGMYIHTFLFQWQLSVTAEMKERAAREVLGLQGQIPGLLETSYGGNISPRSQGFTHGGVMKFRDKAALDGYFAHPVHQKLVDWLMPLLKLAAELDYEIQG